MSFEYDTEKREFVRIHTDIPVRYKFLSRSMPIESEGDLRGHDLEPERKRTPPPREDPRHELDPGPSHGRDPAWG